MPSAVDGLRQSLTCGFESHSDLAQPEACTHQRSGSLRHLLRKLASAKDELANLRPKLRQLGTQLGHL